jgi:hypothetical protein
MTFEQPQKISDADAAFPAKVKHLMPKYEEIPEEFKNIYGEWGAWQAKWFYNGLERMPIPKPGIDINKAMRHLTAIQRSYEPKHEHKQAAVAYLASKWFEKP